MIEKAVLSSFIKNVLGLILFQILCGSLALSQIDSLENNLGTFSNDSLSSTLSTLDSLQVLSPIDSLVDSSLVNILVSDSTKKKKKVSRPPYDPKIAVRRSLIFPGMGQVYNRRYWKLPIIYGGFAGLTYVAITEHRDYKSFQKAYLYRTDDDESTIDTVYVGATDNAVLTNRNGHRRNRDLMFIFMAGLHALNAIEAYVDAHLKGFDVSEDLTMVARPTMLGTKPTEQGLKFVPGANLTFTF